MIFDYIYNIYKIISEYINTTDSNCDNDYDIKMDFYAEILSEA